MQFISTIPTTYENASVVRDTYRRNDLFIVLVITDEGSDWIKSRLTEFQEFARAYPDIDDIAFKATEFIITENFQWRNLPISIFPMFSTSADKIDNLYKIYQKQLATHHLEAEAHLAESPFPFEKEQPDFPSEEMLRLSWDGVATLQDNSTWGHPADKSAGAIFVYPHSQIEARIELGLQGLQIKLQLIKETTTPIEPYEYAILVTEKIPLSKILD